MANGIPAWLDWVLSCEQKDCDSESQKTEPQSIIKDWYNNQEHDSRMEV